MFNKRLHNFTLISIGIIAYVFADTIHEAIGHGLTSQILGNKILLLTSVYFKSEPHSFVTDAFGPLLNLIAGFAIWATLKQIKFTNLYIRLLFILTMSFNFFWFSWMCIFCGITNSGDLAFYISGKTELIIWRIFLILFGLFAYYFTFKIIFKSVKFKNIILNINTRQLFSIPYLSAGVGSLIAVSFYSPLQFSNYYEAFVFPMFFPVLFLARDIPKNRVVTSEYSYAHKKKIIRFAVTLFVLFCIILGKGVTAYINN